jgi:hypothetical protein
MEQGKDTRNFQRRYPEIAWYYRMYLEARNRSIVTTTLPKGKEQKLVIVPFTTGYAVLPAPGGLLDQPYRLMEFWSLFMEGDRTATIKSLS